MIPPIGPNTPNPFSPESIMQRVNADTQLAIAADRQTNVENDTESVVIDDPTGAMPPIPNAMSPADMVPIPNAMTPAVVDPL